MFCTYIITWWHYLYYTLQTVKKRWNSVPISFYLHSDTLYTEMVLKERLLLLFVFVWSPRGWRPDERETGLKAKGAGDSRGWTSKSCVLAGARHCAWARGCAAVRARLGAHAPHHQPGPTHHDVPPSPCLLATSGHSGTCCARSGLLCPPPAGKKEKTPWGICPIIRTCKKEFTILNPLIILQKNKKTKVGIIEGQQVMLKHM
jgi:hypothetical protein